MPGTDPREAANIVLGELPEFPYLPELPARGVGADIIGRSAALLVDLAVDVVPSGYRVAARPGSVQRRAVDLLRKDVDTLDEMVERAGASPGVVKVQLAGPWTLTAEIELARGHRVLTDRGAVREFTESLVEGLRAHIAEVARRTGSTVVVQLDEPSLPQVLAGALRSPSGYEQVPAVPQPEAVELLARVISAARAATGAPVLVHCCAPRPPIALFRKAGAAGVSLDASSLDGAPTAFTDELGQAWDSGTVLLLGLVPSTDRGTRPDLRTLAGPALRLVDRLGFSRTTLAELAVPTPSCGLAGASTSWLRTALSATRDLGKAFVEPPEDW
ncbi:methionine synthase [Tamaricihabitans halophyticus]